MFTVRCGLASLLSLYAFAAQASGLSFGENGARALSQGGAFAAQADDLTAIQHNPAGLSQLSGFHFLVDGELLGHGVTFLRKDPGGAAFTGVQTVSNSAGLFLLPNVGLGYGLSVGQMPLTVAFGVYGPPSVGRYRYPTPNYEKNGQRYAEDPGKYAPQRYALIASDTVILYPSLSVSLQPVKWFSLGGSLQYVYSTFQFSQAIYSGTSFLGTPERQSQEQPFFDSVASVDLRGKPGVAGVLGVLLKPAPWLSVGASARPPVTFRASGDFLLQPGEAARAGSEIECENREVSEDGLTVRCPQAADFTLHFPLELKLGARVSPLDRLGINLELTYEGWSAMDEITLVPRGVQVKLGENTAELEPVIVPKHWMDVLGARAGLSYDFEWGLSVRVGGMYEQRAAPTRYTSVDFPHLTRLWATGGLGYRLGGLSVEGGFAWTPTVTQEVTDSQVRQATTDPQAGPGGVVGNGTYTSGGWVAALGVRGAFGGQPAQAGESLAPTYIIAGR